ncbi:dehydratase domain protein, partial [Leptospira interrogans serovar Australis str. 200703203]
VEISQEEIDKRLKSWKPIEPRYKTGVLAKYVKLVQSATNGAITNLL